MKNPFTPSFGHVPPVMAGRERLIRTMLQALENGPGDPNLSTILVGARGTGKTALLTRLSEEAENVGWISANVSALPGMLDDILVRAQRASAHIIDAAEGARLKSVNIAPLGGIAWEPGGKPAENWRSKLETLIMLLEEQGTGLLITVDEVKSNLDEMVQLAAVYQHFVREQRRVALVMAGLPSMVSELVSNESISFLRRARRHHFGRIPNVEIGEALGLTIRQAGRTIDPKALDLAIDAIDGFPYMMQLVGYEAWLQNPDAKEISYEDVRLGAALADREMQDHVLDATLRDLSRKDVEFLMAMAEDEGDSRLADIAARMNVKSNYASQYKRRLIEQGVIGERGRGEVGFDIPGFREFLLNR